MRPNIRQHTVITSYSIHYTKLYDRTKEPYTGLYNFVGGKVEKGETETAAAYREMTEETGITNNDITLHYLMSTKYFKIGFSLEIFAGRLKHDVKVYGEENPLCWVSADEDFFDTSKFAGDGNLGHIIRIRITSYNVCYTKLLRVWIKK